MRIPLAAIGFTATIAQIVLMREFVATFYGNELLIGLVLMVWLAWTAVGAWGLARIAVFRRMGIVGYGAGLVLSGLLFPVQIAIVRNIRELLDITSGAYIQFESMLGAVVLILSPLCLLGGLLFARGAQLFIEKGRTAGQAYVWESIGSIAGGMLFSFVLVHFLDPLQIALLVVGIDLTVAVFLYLSSTRLSLRTTLVFTIITLGITLSLALFAGSGLHQSTLRWQWPNMVYAADSPYGRIIIQAWDEQRAFFQNGLLAFETQGTLSEDVVHFPLLMHADPEQVLLIGGGISGNLREILKHPVAQVTYVELDPTLIEAARAHLPPGDSAELEDPRVHVELSDGRLFVKRTSQRFDVIILDLPEPSTGALNRFYTREFFAEARNILLPGGIFALGLPSAENYWSSQLARRNASVYHTLEQVFPQVVVTPGEHNFFLASEHPLDTDPALLSQRLVDRGVENRWVIPAYIEYVFTTDRYEEVRQVLERMEGVRLNQDLRPICYYYDLSLWFSLMYPSKGEVRFPILMEAFERAEFLNFWWIGLPLVVVFILGRWQRKWAVSITIACIGLTQMTLQVVILFSFQVLHGYVYSEVSLIVTAFMAGLTLGGATSNHWLSKRTGSDPEQHSKIVKRALLGDLIAIFVYNLVFPLVLRSPVPAPGIVFPMLALLAGFLTGVAFPLCVALVRGDAGRTAGMLYASDLLGGCLGAFLGAVFLVPVFGIPETCFIMALVALSGFLVLVS